MEAGDFSMINVWRVMVEAGQVSLAPIEADRRLATLDDTDGLIPQGVYTTFRTYQHDLVLHLDDHFARLQESAVLAGQAVPVDREIIRQALRLAIAQYPARGDLRLRLVIDLVRQPGTTYLAAAPLQRPSEQDYRQGVKTITCGYERHNPKAKMTGIIAAVAPLRQQFPPDVNEALIVSPSGIILEGLSSNFFAVKSGIIFTAEEGVLSGITRLVVLDEALAAGLQVDRAGLPLAQLAFIQEAFITSVSREVLPVRQVDAIVIGAGQPGQVTRLLSERYQQRLLRDLQPI